MKSIVKLAAIHSRYLDLPGEAKPYSTIFDVAAPKKYIESNIEKIIAFLHQAGKSKVDLVCTTEDFGNMGTYGRDLEHPDIFTSLAEEIPGPISQKIGEIAKQYSMYIATNYIEKVGNKLYNTSVLIGRNGELTGKYRKVHPADGERWVVSGGEEFPVFETDIGKIGFAICYDIVFPEHSRAIAMNGADIIIHQTQGWGICGKSESITGEAFMRTRAAENSVYLIVAKNLQTGDGGKSCIIDNNGSILAESSVEDEGVVIAEFMPDYDMLDEYNYDNFYAGVPSTRARQLLARRPSLYTPVTNEKPPVLERYRDMELHTTHVQAKAILNKWEKLNSKEKTKFHW